MNDEHYLGHCMALLEEFSQNFTQRTAELADDDPLKRLAASYAVLAESKEDIYEGIENFYPTFKRLFSGEKRGKLLLKIID